MKIALDFDGVLHNPKRLAPHHKMGPPIEGAVESVRWLREQGHTLTVFTHRGGKPEHVTDWLQYFRFPNMPVTNIKADYEIIIDDRAWHFTDWAGVREALR